MRHVDLAYFDSYMVLEEVWVLVSSTITTILKYDFNNLSAFCIE